MRVGDNGLETFDPHPGVVGRIDLGAHRDYKPTPADEPTGHFCLLLELFSHTGASAGLYWAGRSNQIGRDPRGIEVTYDVFKARQIPLGMKDVAEQLAEALNEYSSIPVEMLGRKWRAVEHGFS